MVLIRNHRWKMGDSFDSFGPNSLFDVPLSPFPPGCRWSSTLEMVEEIFADLQIPWVQDFILRSHPKQDVYALNDENNYSRAISNSLTVRSLPGTSGGADLAFDRVRLEVPVVSIGKIGVGVGIERWNIEKTSGLCSKELQFSRFVCNNEKHRHLHIGIYEDLGTVHAKYTAFSKNGLWVGCILTLNLRYFLEAFDKKTSYMNTQFIIQGLIQSHISGVQYPQKPTILTNHLYPNKVSDNTGDHFTKSISCAHAGGQPMMALSMFLHAIWSYNYDACELKTIRHWAMIDRVHRMQLSPPRKPLSFTDDHLYRDIEHPQTCSNPNIRTSDGSTECPSTTGTIAIAPRFQIEALSSHGDEVISYEELRKRRKREAASRAYQRKLGKK